MINYSEKLEIFHEKLLDSLNINYPDYIIGTYCNGLGRIPWLSVIDRSTNLRIAEVFSVDRFGSEDTMGTTLLVIDYVNSDSNTHKNIVCALDNIKCILMNAFERKRANANEKQCEEEPTPDSPIPISANKIATGTINPNKFYLVTGRHNGKTLFYQNLLKNLFGFQIKDVIFNDPATVVLWGDGEKTVVQCQDGEKFDPEKGLAMAISKKIYGNKHDYYEVFKKWVGKYNKKKFREALNKAMEITPEEIIRDGHRYVLVKDGTEVTDNGVISNVKIDETGTVLKPFCDIKIDNSEKPEDNGNADD